MQSTTQQPIIAVRLVSVPPARPVNFFDKRSEMSRRRRLILLTRRAYVAWMEACYQVSEIETAFKFDEELANKGRAYRNRLLRRYNFLETTLADESGVSKSHLLTIMACWNGNIVPLIQNLTTDPEPPAAPLAPLPMLTDEETDIDAPIPFDVDRETLARSQRETRYAA